MKKRLAALLAALSLGLTVTAESGISFFTDEVPRYEGLAVGVSGLNQWSLGEYSTFALGNAGGGLDVEYTLPLVLPNNLDLGVSVHAEAAVALPKADTVLKSDTELRASGGVWLRLPFAINNLWFAFQPELSIGASIFNTSYQNKDETKTYTGSVIGIAPAVRFIPQPIPDLEIEAAPLFTITPEAESHMTMLFGLRIGGIYHIQNLISKKQAESRAKKDAELAEQQRLEREKQEEEARLLKEEEERRRREIAEAADEETRRLAEEELRKAEEARRAAEEKAAKIAEEEAHRAEIAAWPAPAVTLSVRGADRFTPDGDGNNDTVIFTSGINYIEETPESWTLTILDPYGNTFRTFKGTGALPEFIEWNGTSDKGEVVASKNTYKARLTVVLSKIDRTRTGTKTAETTEEIHTGLLLQVIVPEHEWKIVVQTIAFDADAASFDKLSAEQVKANSETLDEVAQQIREHPGAIVIVEGYANNISGTEKENNEELIPLSTERAKAIVLELVKRGIDVETLSAVGMGGANPLASRSDKANWWKNRRVEFKITK